MNKLKYGDVKFRCYYNINSGQRYLIFYLLRLMTCFVKFVVFSAYFSNVFLKKSVDRVKEHHKGAVSRI